MFSAILSFLGGSAFRMIWGEISSHLTAKRDHQFEIERMKLQAQTDNERHAREMESVKQAHEMNLEVVRVQGDVDLDKIDAQNFGAHTLAGLKPTNIYLVDLWNASIRPAAASLCLWLWFRSLYVSNWVMQGRDWDMVCAILGWFFADRTLGKRGR